MGGLGVGGVAVVLVLVYLKDQQAWLPFRDACHTNKKRLVNDCVVIMMVIMLTHLVPCAVTTSVVSQALKGAVGWCRRCALACTVFTACRCQQTLFAAGSETSCVFGETEQETVGSTRTI